ncbi:MAG: HDIG domain-containing protein [Polyangiales bacterium]
MSPKNANAHSTDVDPAWQQRATEALRWAESTCARPDATSADPQSPAVGRASGDDSHGDDAAAPYEGFDDDTPQGAPELAEAAPEKLPPEAFRALPLVTVRRSFDAILLSRQPDVGLDALLAVGALDAILPEVSAMVGFGDGEWKHKDVWLHTKQVVKQSVPRLEVRWGALLHDIGKLRTRRIDESGAVTFYGHSEVGARMFERKVAARLGFEGELRERVHFLILHHLRPGQYKESWTDAAVRRFYKQMDDGLTDLLDLGRADITTKRPERRRRGVRQISLLKKRIEVIRADDNKLPALPKGLGTRLIADLGIPASRELGDLVKALEAEVAEGLIEARQDADYYVEHVRTNAARLGVTLPDAAGDAPTEG